MTDPNIVLKKDDEKEKKTEKEDGEKDEHMSKSDAIRLLNVMKKMQAEIEGLKAKSSYPQQFTGQIIQQTGTVEVNPEGHTSLDGDKVHTLATAEGSVKPNQDTMTTAGAFTTPDSPHMGKTAAKPATQAAPVFDAAAFKAELLAAVKAEVPALIKASTPQPMGYRETLKNAAEGHLALMKEMVYAAVDDERKRSVMSTDGENGSGGFLQLSAPQAEEHYIFLRKMVENGPEVA